LEEDATVAVNAMNSEMVGLIISEANDLSRMVDDLLTTARLDAGALHYQFENLSIVDEVREVVGPIERSGADIGVHVAPGLVRSDRLRLRQVVRNLLSNARKYGGPHARVTGQHVAGWYEIRVEDDGEGILEQLRQRLFQRYLHEGDVPIILGSVGLGLSIVRALAEGMGGAVWYERREGWTSFVVRVPLATDTERSQYREPALGSQTGVGV
jgi:signal transduction histidine kinase